jgi:2-dehydropantoate 2-reductase
VRVVVLGAGAVGGVVAARLAQHGHDVAVIARGEHGRVIASDGLTLESPKDRVTVHLPVATDPSGIDWTDDDVVLLATKSQDTAGALDGLIAAGVAASTPVACLQNGVGNEPKAQEHFRRVYGVPVMAPTLHLRPGVVEAYSYPISGLLDVGCWPEGIDGVAVELSAALADSTFDSHPIEDVARWKYTKLLMNLGNAVEALCGPSAFGGELWSLARSEGRAALDAAAIPSASDVEEAARRGDLLRWGPIDGRRRPGGSTWQSVATGRSVETHDLNGEIVRIGERAGVPTPANALLVAAVDELVASGARPGTIDEAILLARLGQD